MSRLTELRRFTALAAKGVEIAPYFNPIVPKSLGYDVLIVDVFDTDRLHENALQDPNIPDERVGEIEPVDVVADASRIGEELEARGLAGKIDYIVSSHNFEHLPDPVRFLRGCETALREGGVLSMAIPDYRTCFDHFRMPTRLADWLTAYHDGRSQPSPATIFDFRSTSSLYDTGNDLRGTCDLARGTPEGFRLDCDLKASYASFLARRDDPGTYQDAHCSTVFGPLMDLLLLDLRYLGLIGLEVIEITQTRGHEFFVHLRKPVRGAAAMDDIAHGSRRLELLRQVNANLGTAGFTRLPVSARVGRTAKRLAGRLIGSEHLARFQAWNRRRRARRRLSRGD